MGAMKSGLSHDSNPVLCRPAFARDRQPVMEFLPAIWEGEDYVPVVWDRWLKGEPGLLAVAERGGEIVGQGHMLDMGGGEWWLEGLRVRPDQQGEGLGSHLHDYFVDRWLETDGSVVRLATHLDRVAVRKMCERTGFAPLADFAHTEAVAAPSSGADGELLPASVGLEEAVQRLSASDLASAMAGLGDFGWRFAELTAERVASSEHLQLLQRPEDGRLALLNVERGHPGRAQLSALEGGEATWKGHLRQLRNWLVPQGLEKVTWLPPRQEQALEAAIAAGFTVHEGDNLYIYERAR